MESTYEMFKDIPGYEGKYQATTEGRIWSIVRQKYLKPKYDRYGYQRVNLIAKNGKKKTELIHRLVALTWLPREEGKNIVDHQNSIPDDNRVSNLSWTDIKGNTKKAWDNNEGGYKERNWVPRPVRCIDTGVEYPSISEAERQTGVNSSCISAACRGLKKTAGGYHWEYV